jgi:hypothetical protein
MSHEKNNTSSKTTIVHQSIAGIPYPATKEELITYAGARSDRDEIVDILNKLPPLEYRNEPHVLSTLREFLEGR